MKASWKTSGAGIATIVVGVGNLVISAIQNKTVTMDAAGVAVTAVIAGIGLMNAKDDNVSNSPHPLADAQTVPNLDAVAERSLIAPLTAPAPPPAAPIKETPAPQPGSHKF